MHTFDKATHTADNLSLTLSIMHALSNSLLYTLEHTNETYVMSFSLSLFLTHIYTQTQMHICIHVHTVHMPKHLK